MAQTRRDLPAWYHRLVARDIETYPRDFDQDISDICTSDEEVEDGADSPDSGQSNRSYQGPDARYYYRLKQQRKWRKLDLRDIREQWQREMEECRLSEKKKEEETQRVYDSVKNRKEGK